MYFLIYVPCCLKLLSSRAGCACEFPTYLKSICKMHVPEPLHDSGWNLKVSNLRLKAECHQTAQDFIQTNLKYLGLNDFPRQPVLMLDCSSGKRFYLYLDKMAQVVIFLEILWNSVFSATWYLCQTNNCLLMLNFLLIYNAALWIGKKEFSLHFDSPIFLVLLKLY